MVAVERGSVEDFFHDVPLGRRVYDELVRLVDGHGPATARVTKSQVAFVRRRGFCWVWLPPMYLSHPGVDVVVSVALDRPDPSPRWKQTVHVGGHWMHHLEVHDVAEIDAAAAAIKDDGLAAAARRLLAKAWRSSSARGSSR